MYVSENNKPERSNFVNILLKKHRVGITEKHENV